MVTINKNHISSNELLEKIQVELLKILKDIEDPELTFISIYDLGILRQVKVSLSDNFKINIEASITPSFSGCPAITVIEGTVEKTIFNYINKLSKSLYDKYSFNINVKRVLSPVWRSANVTSKGKRLLKENGIAFEEEQVTCPRCESINTNIVNFFGSTPCKSFFTCGDCQEPFEAFKRL